ncbi:DLH domain-containing protein [Heracleum sosnowskyi]|uniref:DLH domain-containing protein n=1 Tax=Heracleum sosnowskyi TaxID=360622 RepID=A0AAD8J9I3_9APIA|nr:DLH domain-containing protein [Heracleum sosnowskyi]
MLGPQCCENPPNFSSGGWGEGSVVELCGLKTYISGSSSSSTFAVLLISDVHGYEAPKLRKLADKVASAGYYVVVPDFFDGEYFRAPGDKRSLADWVNSHPTAKGVEDAKPIIQALKKQGISEVGAAGFCWGGKVVAELAKSDHIQAAVLLHPAMVTVDDIKEVRVAIAVLGAEFDNLSPPELLKQFEPVLSTKPKVDSYVKIFHGTKHGWTTRYKDEDKMEVESAEEAHKELITWFNKHLKLKRIAKI